MFQRKGGERGGIVAEKVKVSEGVLNALIWMALQEEAKRGGGLMRVLANADNLKVDGYPLLSRDLLSLVSDHDPKTVLKIGNPIRKNLVLSRDVDTSVLVSEGVALVEEDLFLGDVTLLDHERIVGSLEEVEQRLKLLSQQEGAAILESRHVSIADDEAAVKTASAEIGDIAKILKLKPDQITLQAIYNGRSGVMRVGDMLDIFPVMAVVTKDLGIKVPDPMQAGSFQENPNAGRERRAGRSRRSSPWLGVANATGLGILGALLTPIPFVLAFDPLLMRFHPDKVDPVFDGLAEQLDAVNVRMANNVRWAVQVLNVAENSQLLADALKGRQSEVSPLWERHHRALLRSSARLLSAVADSTGKAVNDLVVYQDEVFNESKGNMLPFTPAVLASAVVASRSFFHGMKVSGKLTELAGHARGGADINALTASFNQFARSLSY